MVGKGKIYTNLSKFLDDNLDTLYDLTKKELQKPNLFEIDRENYFKGFSLVYEGKEIFEDIHNAQFYNCWLNSCLSFAYKLMKEDKKEKKGILCTFMRLIWLQPIFVNGPATKRPTIPTYSINMLTESLHNVLPSNDSTTLDPQMIMEEFSKIERELVENWMKHSTFQRLFYLYRQFFESMRSELNLEWRSIVKTKKPPKKLTSSLGSVVKSLLVAAEPGSHKNISRQLIKQVVSCPSYKTENGCDILENTVSHVDACFKVNKGPFERQITLKAKLPSIHNLSDFEYCAQITKYKDIFNEAISNAIAVSSFPVQINDGQQFITLALPDQDVLKCEVDKYGNIRVNFRVFIIRKMDTSNDRLIGDTLITPQMIIMLSLSTDLFKGVDTNVLVQRIAKDPETIYQTYIDLMEKGKNINTSDPDVIPTFSSSSSKSPQEMEIDDLKSSISQNLKRHIIYKRLPVIRKLAQNSRTVTLLLDSKSVSELLNIDLPSDLEKVVMKVNSIDLTESIYGGDHRHGHSLSTWWTFDKSLGALYHKEFLHEVAINFYLDRYNEDSTEENRIRKPKILHAGEILSGNYRGFFHLQEYLPFITKKPSSKKHSQDGLSQLKLLHAINIQHGNIIRRNLCVKKDKIWFINFRHSQVMNNDNQFWGFMENSQMEGVRYAI